MDWKDFYGDHTIQAIRMDVRHPFNTDCNGVALDLGDKVVFAFEDPSDGYRSQAAALLVADGSLYQYCDHVEYIRVPVLIRPLTPSSYASSADGAEFIDRRNGKTVLRVGTDNNDDYYPSFVCEWTPENLAENLGR